MVKVTYTTECFVFTSRMCFDFLCIFILVCRGSREGFVKHGTYDHQYNLYKSRYTNCSYVDGPLEVTHLEGSYDLGFLKDIEEVDGYVLILNVFSNYLNLTKLRIIRGKELFEYGNLSYSLYIALNHNPFNNSQGILELQFTSLKEISRGHVYFKNNNLLCFYNTIEWEDINPTSLPAVNYEYDSPNYKRQCEYDNAILLVRRKLVLLLGWLYCQVEI